MIVTVLVCVLSLAPTQSAPSPNVKADVERLHAEGATLYRAGQHRAAIERFEEAYSLYPDPILLYNTARAYEALGDVDGALTSYRACVVHPQVTPDVAQRAKQKVTTLEAVKARIAAMPAPPPETPAPAAVPAPAASSATAPAPAPVAAAGDEGGGFPLFGALGTGVAAIGVVTAAVGGVWYGLGAAAHGEVDAAKRATDANGVAPMTRAQASQLITDGESNKTIGVIVASAGAGVLLLSAPLFVLELLSGGDEE